MRFRVSQPPFRGPYFFNASSAYWEHVGVKRHAEGVKGEMQSWYTFTRSMSGATAMLRHVLMDLEEDGLHRLFDISIRQNLLGGVDQCQL